MGGDGRRNSLDDLFYGVNAKRRKVMKKLLFTLLAYLPIATQVLDSVVMAKLDTVPLGKQSDMLVVVAALIMLLSIILIIVSMIIFIITVRKRTDFHSGKKVFWIAMFVCYNMFAYPVYLHKYILKKEVFPDPLK